MDVIAGVGLRPEGKNYLSSIVTQIMSDGLYGDVRDRSNANFLWFVTFERRMSDMEQKIKSDGGQEQLQKDENSVISMPQENKIIDHDTNSNGVASVFFLDHFRAG